MTTNIKSLVKGVSKEQIHVRTRREHMTTTPEIQFLLLHYVILK